MVNEIDVIEKNYDQKIQAYIYFKIIGYTTITAIKYLLNVSSISSIKSSF